MLASSKKTAISYMLIDGKVFDFLNSVLKFSEPENLLRVHATHKSEKFL